MGIYSFKPKFQKFLKPVENLFIKKKIHPTTINLLGFGLSILGGLTFYFADQSMWLLLFIPFMGFWRTAFNALDGMIARRLQVKNQEFGEVLNEFLDRASDSSIFLGLAFAHYTNIYLGVIAFALILLNSYLSILSKAAGGTRQYGGVMGKADRMIWIGFLAMVMLLLQDLAIADYGLFFIALGTLVTLGQRFWQIKSELKTE